MRSAQRRQRFENKARKKGLWFVSKLLVIPLVLFIAFIFLKLSTKYWNGSDKMGYAFRLDNGDVAVSVLDPKLGEETTFIIPGDTQVNVAGNFGTFRIKNVWQLGINEKVGGKLLAGTITKNFFFPVFLWSDSDAGAIPSGDFRGLIKFIFSPKNTNIPFGDRLSAGLFAMQVKNIDKTEINLATSSFIERTALNDGQSGYIISGPISQRLTIYFVDNDFSDTLKVGITDGTGVFGISDEVGQIIQVLGGKVVSIDKTPQTLAIDCEVGGKSSKMVEKIIRLFSCKKITESGNFDLEIKLGKLFAARF